MTTEEQFWHWFQEHETELLATLETDAAAFTRRVNSWLGMTHPGLGCEPAARPDGAYWNLYVTARGVIENFEAVDALVAAAPVLAHFRAVAFLPPAEGLQPHPEVRFRHVMDDDRASVTLFVDGYREDDLDQRVTRDMHNLLSALLGEYRCETKIGAVDVEPLSESARNLPPIEQLPQALK